MTTFSDEDLQKLSELCRIKCSEEEKTTLKGNIGRIINYLSELSEVNTEGVEPVFSVQTEHKLILGEDEISETLPREEFLANSPSHIGGMIRVPPVFKQNS